MTKSRGILPPRQPWPPEQAAQLARIYPDLPTAEVARQLGITIDRVYTKAALMGLKKSAAYLSGPFACRMRRGDNVGAANRFKPGLVPWNKGLKGNTYPGCVKTQFKPGTRQGRAAKVYQPVGSERISKDGYLERKTNDGLPFQKRWRAVHLLIWEAANGPLPRGHAVAFKDGDKKNLSLGNLELVPRAELMRRNSYHNYGPELAKIVQLRGAITRQINRRSKNV